MHFLHGQLRQFGIHFGFDGSDEALHRFLRLDVGTRSAALDTVVNRLTAITQVANQRQDMPSRAGKWAKPVREEILSKIMGKNNIKTSDRAFSGCIYP